MMDLDIEPDVNCIENGLYLSDRTAACNPVALKALGITHILTVDTEPLPAHITDGKSRFRTLYIEADDGTHDDLLSHFDKTNKFIEEGITHGSVLVHCFFGISRSATLVVAYVMKHTKLSVQEAVAKVREKRPVISPNLGFLAQLKLYYRMGCRLDVDNISYKLFKLENLAAILKKGRNFELVKKVVAKDPGVPDANVNTDTDVQNVYRCKCCRRQLFSTANLLVHFVGKKPTWNDTTWQVDEESEEAEEEGICSRGLFAEPIEWMEEPLTSLQGKLFCPNCKSKVGSFNWLGIQCSCGVKVVPGFHVSLSKVDECKTAHETPST